MITARGSSVSDGFGPAVQVAVNDRGVAVVTWTRVISQRPAHPKLLVLPVITYAVMTATRSHDRHWGRPQQVGTAVEQRQLPGADVWAPTNQLITVDDRDGAAIVWNSQHGNTQRLLDAVKPPGSARWRAPGLLSASNGYDPTIASDRAGNQTVAWLNTHSRIEISTRTPDGNWKRPHLLAHSPPSQSVWLSVNPSGEAIIARAFIRHPGGSELVSFRHGPCTPWQRPARLGTGWFPAGALDSRGDATVVWPRLITAHRSGYNVIDATSHTFH